MRTVLHVILGSILAAAVVTVTGAAQAQTAKPPRLPASAPASAPLPAAAASKADAAQSPAVRAAESALEPGNQRPEERVIPQISIPFQSKRAAAAAAGPTASAPPGSVPGRVNDGTARCLAAETPAARAACERGLAASAVKPAR